MDVSMFFQSVQRVQLSQNLPEPKSTADQIVGAVVDVFGASSSPKLSETVITLDLTESENYTFDSDITDNPVDSGGNVSDHINNRPDIIQIEGRVVDYPVTVGLFGGVASTMKGVLGKFLASDTRTSQAYKLLKQFREEKRVFNLITPMDSIPDCVIVNISMNRTAEDDGSLPISISMQKINRATALYGMRGANWVGPDSLSGGSAPGGVGAAQTKAAESAGKAGAAVPAGENLGILEGIFGLNPFGG